MLSPIKWIKPRLRPLCVAFGTADMTLVLLSMLCWYFVFDAAFEAQHIHSLHRSQHGDDPTIPTGDNSDNDADEVEEKKFKEDRSPEDLRLERTIRACGYAVDENNKLDESLSESNYAGPAALIGAAMGSYFMIGALLTTLNSVNHPAARRVICAVALFGQGIASFFLFIGVAILSTNEGLCRLEYYYEFFQPVLSILVVSMIFIFTYKTYEVTIIAFYFGEQSTVAREEEKQVGKIRHSMAEGRKSMSADLKKLAILQANKDLEFSKAGGGGGDHIVQKNPPNYRQGEEKYQKHQHEARGGSRSSSPPLVKEHHRHFRHKL